MTVRIKFIDKEIEKFLEKFKKVKGRPSELLNEIGKALVTSTKERFSTQQSPDKTKFKALSPRYLTSKIKKGFKGGILSRTGELKKSIRYEVDGKTLTVGSNQVYAATHQFGSKINNIPARPYLGLSKLDEERISTLFLEALSD